MATEQKQPGGLRRKEPQGALNLSSESPAAALREFREQYKDWTPRTQLGRRLKQLREQFIAEGGELLTPEEIDAEVRERRGGMSAED